MLFVIVERSIMFSMKLNCDLSNFTVYYLFFYTYS